MDGLISVCNVIVSRSLQASRNATFGSYYTLCGLNVFCATVAIARLYFLPNKPTWPPHRTFLLLVLAGCCIGTATAFFRMHQVFYGISASKNGQDLRLDAQSNWNGAWFYLLTPWETTCLLFAKLLVLNRMEIFAHRFRLSDSSLMSQFTELNSRNAFLATIAALLAIGFCSYSAGAVLYFQSSALKFSSSALNISDPNVKDSVYSNAASLYNKSRICLSVHDFSESCMLFIIIGSFCTVGLHIRKRIRSVIGKLPSVNNHVVQNAIDQGASLNKRIGIAVTSIFVSFLLRLIWVFVNAIAALAVKDPSCESECSDCQNWGYLLSKILFLGGEFRAVWVMLSNPLVLTISVLVMREKSRLEWDSSTSHSVPLIGSDRQASVALSTRSVS
jgi:hypothetical protein